MAPNADRLRQRRHTGPPDVPSVVRDEHHPTPTTTIVNEKTPSSEHQQRRPLTTLGGTELVIDGVIYDIAQFQHPGGDSIQLFGGNDVTVQYKMIHPYHTRHHLQKMGTPVGTIPDIKYEYAWDTPFERDMKAAVFRIVSRGKEFGTTGYFVRALGYIGLFFYLQYCWMQPAGTSYPLAILYGMSMGLIGLNVQHDANHGAASKQVWINDLLGLGADFIGGSKWLWMEKHWTHHAYTNHHTKDPDGLAAEPFLLFNDYALSSTKRCGYHAYQAFYFVLVLCGYWISAILDLPVIWSLRDRGAAEVGIHVDNPWIASRRKYAIGLRLLYLYCNIYVPLAQAPCAWTTFVHIQVMGIAGSLTLGLLFTLSHNFEQADRDPTKDFRHTGHQVCWFKAQVETSSTYGGFVSGWLTGGLNFQVEHHLFPRMSSAWYPYIAPTVRRVCKEHNVRYVYYPWLWQNMYSTLKYTHAVGNGSHHDHPLLHRGDNPFLGSM